MNKCITIRYSELRKSSILTLLSISLAICSFAQDEIDIENYEPSISIREKEYRAKITLTNGLKMKAKIRLIDDYSIHLKDIVYKKKHRRIAEQGLQLTEFRYDDIQHIKIKNMGAAAGGFLAGSTVGVLGGGVVGLAMECEDCDSSEKIAFTVFFAGLGALILGPYGAIDSPFMNYEIAGQYNNFNEFKEEIETKQMKRIIRKTKR